MINSKAFKEATWFFKYNGFDRNVNKFLHSAQFEGLVRNNYDKINDLIETLVDQVPEDLQEKAMELAKNTSVYPTYMMYRRTIIAKFKIQLYEEVRNLYKLVRKETISRFYAEILAVKETYHHQLIKVEKICKDYSNKTEQNFFQTLYMGYFPNDSDVPPELSEVLKSVFGASSLIPV